MQYHSSPFFEQDSEELSGWTSADFLKSNLLCERLVEAAGEIMKDSCQLKEALNQISRTPAQNNYDRESKDACGEVDHKKVENQIKTTSETFLFC